ncbi:hypothetical protein MC885_003770, partial [Smutsia gigantea]
MLDSPGQGGEWAWSWWRGWAPGRGRVGGEGRVTSSRASSGDTHHSAPVPGEPGPPSGLPAGLPVPHRHLLLEDPRRAWHQLHRNPQRPDSLLLRSLVKKQAQVAPPGHVVHDRPLPEAREVRPPGDLSKRCQEAARKKVHKGHVETAHRLKSDSRPRLQAAQLSALCCPATRPGARATVKT